MKEYLTKKEDGTYTITLGGGDIEIPEGAEYLTKCDEDGKEWLLFWMENCKWCVGFDDEWVIYEKVEWYIDAWKGGACIVWSRHTQPEELPFIDDEPRAHSHYFKDVSHLKEIDVYQVLQLFNVTDPCLQHIVKKALCAGQRGHKNFETDLKNIRDTAIRAIEINCKP